jgi:hypothetical protein
MFESRKFQSETHDSANDEPRMDSFVPAMQWDELRKLYPPKRSRSRGLRRLSQVMETENPENLDGAQTDVRWSISPMDCSMEVDVVEESMDLIPDRIVAELDACYASETFMDDLDWALQTYDICQRDFGEEDNMDEELEMLEAVQDLTRFVAKTSPRRAATAPVKPSIPD